MFGIMGVIIGTLLSLAIVHMAFGGGQDQVYKDSMDDLTKQKIERYLRRLRATRDNNAEAKKRRRT